MNGNSIRRIAAAAMLLALAAGCGSPRVVFVPAATSPVRAGPDLAGHVYVWNGQQWELSGNRVVVPEGYYVWDAGDPATTNAVAKGR
jgi:hypothetical protein